MASPTKWKAREDEAPQFPELARVRGAEAGLADAQRVLDAAQVAAQDAESHAQKCESTCGAARARHDEAQTPTPADAAAETAADAALARAVRLRAEAGARLAAAIESASVAQAALEASKLDVKKTELRTGAAPATLAAAIGPHWAALVDANARATAATTAIAAAWADSVAASAELRKLGEHVADLDRLHALLPGLRRLAENGVVADLDQVRHTPITTAALAALLAIPVRPELAHHVAPFRARLERHAGTRNGYEAFALEVAEGKAAQAARDESAEGQENARRQAEHNERTKRPRFRGYDQ
jgi:hypothetical protein